jgi:hypothetical protein
MVDDALQPLDFVPGWLTRLRLWRAHGRLHRIIRTNLVHHGEVGAFADCAHCHRRWIVRQGAYATCLREARH